ncbi:MAG TPA: hypothetical protein VFX70_10865 [Mycobacteriales bacterium]|nr:hypothetical protein [Mycobacteriales bacterium]
MLRTLGHPISFLGLVAGFVVGIFVLHYAQVWVARLLGDRVALRAGHDLRRAIDPFGAVAAAISVPGWGSLADTNLRSTGRRAAALLAGPLAAAAVGLVALAGYLGLGGPPVEVGPGDLLGGAPFPAAQSFLLCAGVESIGVAVLSLVPLPPLTGWRLLQLASANTLGWQRARYWLEERNIGVVILLVLLIFPLGRSGPLLVELVNAITRPLTGLLP